MAERFCKGCKNFVSGKMTVCIVEILKMVDVQHKNCRMSIVTPHECDFFLNAVYKIVIRIQSGFRVSD